MFVCYADESGFCGKKANPKQPLQVMAAVMPNVYNLHKTTNDFNGNVKILRKHGIGLRELKADQIYSGRGPWGNVDGVIRHRIFNNYFRWLSDRRHRIILSVIDNKRFFDKKKAGDQIAKSLDAPYVAAAVHIALVIQKINMNQKKNKGKTILIFDEQQDFENMVSELIANPPEFTDEFYGIDSEIQDPLDQIIDTAYFICSDHSYLIQVVDSVAFVSRKFFELFFLDANEAYEGERQKIRTWFNRLLPNFVASNKIYPNKKVQICRFYKDLLPFVLPF